MNIFALSNNPIDAARWQHDRHVNKMTVESAQLLSAACHEDQRFMDLMAPHHLPLLYKMSHKNNPLTNWTKETAANFTWLVIHASALVAEKHRRWPTNGMHSSYPLIVGFQAAVCKLWGVDRFYTRNENRELIVDPALMSVAATHTPFYQAMPDDYKSHNAQLAYLTFYLEEKIFQDHVKWTNCDMIPDVLFSIVASQRSLDRLEQLVTAHRDGINAARAPRDPHPDLLKPKNPNAIRKFGVRS